MMAASLQTAAKTYIEETLGKAVIGSAWAASNWLPFFMQDRYEFAIIHVAESPCLLMFSNDVKGETPAVVRKHLKIVEAQFSGPVIYVVAQLSSYNRKRLIAQGVQFLVPGKQLYIPVLGVVLQERSSVVLAGQELKSLGAVAQVLVLRQIYQLDDRELSVSDYAGLLGYSVMTISRAFAEIKQSGCAGVQRAGKHKYLQFDLRAKDLWSATKERLQSPVKKNVWITEPIGSPGMTVAGETALSLYSLLAEPRYKTIAVGDLSWPKYEQLTSATGIDSEADGKILLQRWRYDPSLVKEGPVVDELSLWLSLQDVQDERVEQSLDTLLEAMNW